MTIQVTRQPRFTHLRPSVIDKIRYTAVLAGDRQRDQVTSFLGLAYSEGFIDRDELSIRSDQALQARTEDQLAAVLYNLPDEISTVTETSLVPLPGDDTLTLREIIEEFPYLAAGVIACVVILAWVIFSFLQIIRP